MADSATRIIRESKGEPTVIEVPAGYSALVVGPQGSLDLALIPELETLEQDDEGNALANEGMLRMTAMLLAATDPDVRALVEKKINEDSDPA